MAIKSTKSVGWVGKFIGKRIVKQPSIKLRKKE